MDILLVVIVVGIIGAAVWGSKRLAKTEETVSSPVVEPAPVAQPELTVLSADNPVAKEEAKKYKQGAKKPSAKKAAAKKPAKKSKKDA